MSSLNLLRDAGMTTNKLTFGKTLEDLGIFPGDWLYFDNYSDFIDAANGGTMKTLTFDTETTGVDTTTDRIIELCMSGNDFDTRTIRFKPSVPISPEAQEVHGISMEDLKDCPRFINVAHEIYPFFKRADVLIGYNVGFDIAMVCEAFERCDMPLDVKGKQIVDPLKLWYQMEPRNLEAAYEKFVGEKLEGAHAAETDVRAADEVLYAMMTKWRLLNKDWTELADLCEPDRHTFVGVTNHFLWDDEGKVVFGFGKHKGERAAHNMGYLRWMLNETFPSSVKASIRSMLDRSLKR